jgi:hypothetical protein
MLEAGALACVGCSGAGESAGDEVKFSPVWVIGADVSVDWHVGEVGTVNGDRIFIDVAVGGCDDAI